jgi:hypothetical protein
MQEKKMNILTANFNKLPFQNEPCWLLFTEDKKPLHPLMGVSEGWNSREFLVPLNAALNNQQNNLYYLGCGVHGLSNAFWVDLDNCFKFSEDQETLEEWAYPFVDLAIRLKLYIEVSVSGNGLHIAGSCVDFDEFIHTKHIYSKGVTEKNIKSKAIELFLSTAEKKCKRGLLVTGNIYRRSTFNSGGQLPTVSKNEIIDILKEVHALKIIQNITRSGYVVKENEKVQIVYPNANQDNNFIVNEVMDIALFDDKIKFLYNYEDVLSGSFDEVREDYIGLREEVFTSFCGKSTSENDFQFVLYLTRYTFIRSVLIACLLNSPRALQDNRKLKMYSKHSEDGRTYAELTVDKALAIAMPSIQEEIIKEGGICMSYLSGMEYMNSRYVKYQDTDDVKVVEYYFNKKDGHSYSVYKKISVASYLNNIYVVSKDKSGVFVKQKLFYLWYNSSHGKIVKGFVFAPSKEALIYEKESKHLYFNSFRGWAVNPRQTEIIDVWIDYVKEVICSNDEDDANYFLDYFAHLFQKPNHRPGVALVLKSDKGIGKNLVLEPLQYIMGKNLYFISTKKDDLAGVFNKGVKGRLLIIANEALFAGDHEAQDNLKGLIADKEISITAKHVDSVSSDNYARVVILSNRSSVINFDPTERRYRFFDCNDDFASVRIRENPENYKKLEKLLNIVNSEDYLPSQAYLSHELLSGLLFYFINRDISKFNPRLFEFGKNAGTIRTENNNPVSQFFFNFIESGKLGIATQDCVSMDTIKDYYNELDELDFHPEELYLCYANYHKQYCIKSQMYNFTQFKKKFSELFLNGIQKTFPKRYQAKTIRVWKLDTRLALAAKYGIAEASLND